MILVSACLAGCACRFDGQAKTNPKVVELVKAGKAIPVCPELLAGLPTPRPAAEVKDGRVITASSEDMTDIFQKGAEATLALCQLYGCTQAILKTKSPSCGIGQVFDGSFNGLLVDGDGITAKLLKAHGIEVISEGDL